MNAIASPSAACEDEGPAESEPPRPAPADPEIDVRFDPGAAPDLAARAGWIAARLGEAVRAAALPVRRLTLRIVDDATMAALHLRHSGIAGTTDVLTFPDPDADPGSGEAAAIEGDLALGAEVARRQAEARGHAVERELLLYAVHGLLHLAGYDDHDPEAYGRMHAREDEILRAIGVGTTFADEDAAP